MVANIANIVIINSGAYSHFRGISLCDTKKIIAAPNLRWKIIHKLDFITIFAT